MANRFQLKTDHIFLTGNYKGYMEWHVESDILLIWWDKEEGIINPAPQEVWQKS